MNNGDRPGNDSFEYATLACRCSTTDRSKTTTVNLKLEFLNIGPTVLFANAVVVSDVHRGGIRVYEGCVSRDQAAIMSRRKTPNYDERISFWLQDARAALTGQIEDEKSSIEYFYYLEEPEKSEDNGNGGRTQLLSWKMKLEPLGLAKLGAVNLIEVVAPTTEQMNQRFVEPLISSLSAERKNHHHSDRLAAENMVRLLDDNRRLLEELRSVVESQKQYEQLLMAKFVKVLNEKKKKFAAIQQELTDLKHRDDGMLSVVEKPATVTTMRGRRRSVNRGCLKKTKSKDDKLTIKKNRTVHNDETKQNLFFSKKLKQENQADNMEVIGQQHKADNQQQEFEPIEMDNIKSVRDNNSLNVDNIADVKTVVEASKIISIPVNYDVFAADTQIDDIMSDSSPPWLQNSIPVTLSSQHSRSPVPHKDDSHQSPKKNVIDSLWAGLL